MRINRSFQAALCVVAICGAKANDANFAMLMKQGDALDAQLKTREALAVYLEAEKLQPANAILLSHIAKQYGESMDDTTSNDEKRALGEKALGFAQRAVAADPGSALTQLSLAISYGRLAPLLDNRTKIAYSRLVKEHVDKAMALNPGDDLAWHVLGAWNYELANINGFVRVIAKIIYGEIPAASNGEAEKDFHKAIDLNPRRVGNWVELGRTYAAMGRKEEARDALSKGLALPDRDRDDEFEKNLAREALKTL